MYFISWFVKNYLHHKLINTCNRIVLKHVYISHIVCIILKKQIHSIFLHRLAWCFSNIFHHGIRQWLRYVMYVNVCVHVWCFVAGSVKFTMCPLENQLLCSSNGIHWTNLFTKLHITSRIHITFTNNNHTQLRTNAGFTHKSNVWLSENSKIFHE